MKICIAQTQSIKGDIPKNIQTHLQIIENAIKLNADLVIFPELSITGYEPDLAKALATTVDAAIFNSFQFLSDKHNLTIGIGMPTTTIDGINISMLIFQPNEKRSLYSKQMLHTDELPYFVCGKEQVFINIKGQKIAIGICYETLQRQHFLNAIEHHATIYIASVAKPKSGIEKAFSHFPKMANEFQIPILMSNCVGYCDNFLSVGQSAIWNKNGNLVGQLDDKNQGFLIYNTMSATVKNAQLKIEKGQLSDLETLFDTYRNGKIALDNQGIFQWTDNYPNRSIIGNDLQKGDLYLMKQDTAIIGAIILNEEQDEEYQAIDWQFDDSKVLVIHRLVVNPQFQKQGFATQFMDFAESFARNHGYSSIRLDVYTQNKRAIELYKRRQYIIRGNIYFHERIHPFHCMEKKMVN